MSLSDLIALLEKRLVYLGSLRSSAAALGDVAQIERIDADSAETQQTLNRIRATES